MNVLKPDSQILMFWIFAVDFWKKLQIYKFAICGKLTRAQLAHQIFILKFEIENSFLANLKLRS
jgi:hypothetical protein